MKVLYISRRYYPEVIGGGQISAFYIAKAAQAEGVDTYVCTFTDKKEQVDEVLEGVKIRRYPIKKLKFFPRLSNMDYMYWQIAKTAEKMIKEIKPDVVHLLNFESVPFTAFYLKKKFNIKIVATVNSPSFSCFTQDSVDYKEETCINCKLLKRYRCSKKKWGFVAGTAYYIYSLWYMNLLRFSYKYVDNFVLVSKAMYKVMENMDVPEKKCVVIHNPVGNLPKPDIKKVKEIKKRYKGKTILLYAGRLSKEKGIHHTIKALQHLDDSYIFLIIGKKSGYYDELVSLIKKLGIEKRVKFIGFVHNNEVSNYYGAADYVVHLGLIYESYSRMLLEAKHYGCRILAYDVGGNSELKKKGDILISKIDPAFVASKIKKENKNKTKITTQKEDTGNRLKDVYKTI